jgi:hypothetical protein
MLRSLRNNCLKSRGFSSHKSIIPSWGRIPVNQRLKTLDFSRLAHWGCLIAGSWPHRWATTVPTFSVPRSLNWRRGRRGPAFYRILRTEGGVQSIKGLIRQFADPPEPLRCR